MPAPDSAMALLEDLRALPRRARREILSSLSPAERAKVSLLLGGDTARPLPQAPAPDFGHFSPWLAGRLRDLKAGLPTEDSGWLLTPATRRLLLQIVQEEAARTPTPPSDPAEQAGTPSLLTTVGRLLSRKRARS